MKIFLLLSISFAMPFLWAQTDVISGLRDKIHISRITPEVDSRIENALADIESSDYRAASDALREISGRFDTMLHFYNQRQIPKPVLSYVAGQFDTLQSLCDSESPRCIEGSILIDVYDQDISARYDIHLARDVADRESRHVQALLLVPQNVIVPDAPTSNTYQSVVVDISKQLMFAYEEGTLVFVTPVTTGKRGFSTPQGDFKIRKNQTKKWLNSPFKNISYRLHVDYWIEFAPSYGFHDACNSKSCWRTQFGGKDYTTRGSHGCINMPYDAARWLSEWVLVDTAVHIQP